MTTSVKIRPAPSGKLYVVLDQQPICDAAGGLLYFDDTQDVSRFLLRCRTVQVVDLLEGDTPGLALQ